METLKKLVTVEERIDFLENLELETPDTSALFTGEDEADATASIDAGSLLSFAGSLKTQQKSDVLNSCLLAQLAANKQYDREEDTVNWYKYYSYVLQNVGWVMQDFSFDKLSSSGSSFEPSALMLQLMKPVCSPVQLAILTLSLTALSHLDESCRSAKLFETNSHSDKKGNFQLGTCVQEDNQVTMTLGACYLSTKQNITKILFTRYKSSDLDAYAGTQTITLDNDIYSQVRATVIKKLGNHAMDFISDLDI